MGSKTIAPEENRPRRIAHWMIAHWMIAHWMIAPRTTNPEDKCSQGKLPRGQFHPRKITPQENCLLTIKFPPKRIAPTQPNFPQRVLRVNGGKLRIVYENYN